MNTLSVISTTYCKEKPDNLYQCLSSIFGQTLLPDKVILVADGELTSGLYKVIADFKSKYPDLFVFYETPDNKGNWYASNVAVSLCETDIVAKIDSDDILLPDYTAKIVEAFDNGIDICGVYIEEFDDETGEVISIKKTPVKHNSIHAYAKRRNPFNNPGIAFSRSIANKIGVYRNMERCEDYDFCVRMLMEGAKAGNIPKVLVRYRTSADNIRRRKNSRNTKWFIISRWRIHKMGFSSLRDFIIPVLGQILLFFMPVKLAEKFYKNTLR